MTIGSAVQLPIPSGRNSSKALVMALVTIMMTKAFQDREAVGTR